MESQMNPKDILRGHIWKDGVFHDPIPEGLFPAACSPERFAEILKTLDGCFSFVLERGEYLLAAVDIKRSLPLFYAVQQNELLVSADARELRSRLGNPPLDQEAVPEFLLAGIISGNDTLFRNLKQLEAGQYLLWHKPTATLQVKDYFRYSHLYEPIANPLQELDRVHERVFTRLIESARDRTIVIPLSGGNDSRLVAVMLKRLGYPKVLCFTYGSSHLPECQTSRRVAKFLNFPWIIVETNRRLWYQAYHSEEMRRFLAGATHYCTSPHIQDWLAVQTLKQRGLIPDDSIIVPGHSGDFPEGANLPQIFEDKEDLTAHNLLEAIFSRHYNLWYCPNDRRNLLFAERLRNYLQFPDEMKAEIAAGYFDEWDWRNREAKFIVNSVRTYEYFGYDWRIPLWDREFLDFWRRIPLEQRMHQNLYGQYKHRYQAALPPSSNDLSLPERWQKKVRSLSFGNLPNPRYGRFLDYRNKHDYFTTRVATLCAPNISYPDFVNQELPILRADINALQALSFLKELVAGRLD